MSHFCGAIVHTDVVLDQSLPLKLVGGICDNPGQPSKNRAPAAVLYPSSYSSPLTTTRKRSHQDMSSAQPSATWIDENKFRCNVLGFTSAAQEHEAEEALYKLAKDLGVWPLKPSIDVSGIVSSLSATTISSDMHQSSIMSHSTSPTSCASSERRPSTSISEKMNIVPEVPAILEDINTKRSSGGIRNGLRKMGFSNRKKKTLGSGPSMVSINTISSQMTSDTTLNGEPHSPRRGAPSIRSAKSYYPAENAAVQPPVFQPLVVEPLVDQEALQRSMNCHQMLQLQTKQLEEKRRFLDCQTQLISQLIIERDRAKEEKREAGRKFVSEQEERNEKLVESLAARQLEEEMKQQKEFDAEKRAIHTRLKHMEAYCQTPSPPTSPAQSEFLRGPSIDSSITLPERHITQAHYESLAQVYHTRDNMNSLHDSKITVLRGRQERAMQNFMLKKEKEIETLEKQSEKECEDLDRDFQTQQRALRNEFQARGTKLEARWRLQALVERSKMELKTGLKYEPLPDVMVNAVL